MLLGSAWLFQERSVKSWLPLISLPPLLFASALYVLCNRKVVGQEFGFPSFLKFTLFLAFSAWVW
jgi:hypothetical protein